MSSTTNSTRTFMSAKKSPPESNPKKSLPKPNKKALLYLLVVFAGIAVIAAIYFGAQHYGNKSQPSTDSKSYISAQTKRLGKLIILPTDEAPTIATVNDAAKLKSQSFYANAQNGDIVFAYSKAHKAILYRPSQNIIVNVSPVKVSS